MNTMFHTVLEGSPDQAAGATFVAAETSLLLIRDMSPSVDNTNGIFFALLVCILACLTILFRKGRSNECGTPESNTGKLSQMPVAFSIPWIGNLSLLTGLPHLMVSKLADRYGKIFRLNAGGDRKFVLVNDVGMIREAMRRFPSELTGKPQTTTTKMTNAGAQRDMGKRWGRRRHITMTAIKNLFRQAPDTLQDVCESELRSLVQKLRSKQSASHEPTHDITNFVARTIWRLIYGRGQIPDDQISDQLETLSDKIDHYTQNSGPFSLLDRFPFLKKLISQAMDKFKNAVQFMNNFCEENEEKRLSDKGRLDGPHNDIMGFMMKGAQKLTKEDETNLGLTETLLHKGVGDLVRAGTESPSLLLLWLCLVLAKHPEVQDRMAEELDARANSNEESVFYDVPMDKMPYTHAVIYETIRFCSIIPFLKRRTLGDVSCGGYELPVGTDIIINNHAINHDVTRWGDPQIFRPSRFLHTDGAFDMCQLEKFLPFGVGKRRCIGEELGKLIPFAAIATLVSNFNITAPPSLDLSLKPSFGITLTPPKQDLIFESRLNKNPCLS